MLRNNAKTIQIFLPEGNPRGIKIAEVTNRTVQAILIPRNELNEAVKRGELTNVGLYFLFGKDEEKAKPQIYIGEAENCYDRLKQHNKSKDFWDAAIVIVTNNKQNQFTKTDVKFLENYSYEKCREVSRFSLDQTVPTRSFVPEWRQADLFDLFDTMKLLLSTLGYPVFDNLRNKRKSLNENADTLYCENKEIKAQGEYNEEGFVVFKGSQMALELRKSYNKGKSLRQKIIDEGIVTKKENYYVFMTDYLFNSPSAAAGTVKGTSSNGWQDWKNKYGKTLDELKRQ